MTTTDLRGSPLAWRTATRTPTRSAALGDRAAGTSWPWWRRVAVAAAFVGLIAATSGALAQVAFTHPSPTKYIATVTVAYMACVVVTARTPVIPVALSLVFLAPFAPFATTVGGVTIKLAIPLLALACFFFLIGTGRRLDRGHTVRVMPWLGFLLIIPIAIGDHRGLFVTVLATGLLMAWVIARCVVIDGPRKVLLAAIAMCAVQASMALYQYRTGNTLNLYSGEVSGRGNYYFFQYDGQTRPTGSFYDPNALGNVLALSAPLALAFVVDQVRGRRFRAAAMLMAVGALCSIGLLTTLSRMSWIGGASGLTLCVLLMPRRHRGIVVTGLIGAAAVGLQYVGVVVGPALVQRLSSVVQPTGVGVETAQGDSARLQLWNLAEQTWTQNPFAGIGFGDFPYAIRDNILGADLTSHAHSIYLQLAAEGGILALSALLLLVIAVARDLRRALMHYPILAPGVAGALSAVLVTGLTDATMLMQQTVMMIVATFIGVAVGMTSIRDQGADPSARLADMDRVIHV